MTERVSAQDSKILDVVHQGIKTSLGNELVWNVEIEHLLCMARCHQRLNVVWCYYNRATDSNHIPEDGAC